MIKSYSSDQVVTLSTYESEKFNVKLIKITYSSAIKSTIEDVLKNAVFKSEQFLYKLTKPSELTDQGRDQVSIELNESQNSQELLYGLIYHFQVKGLICYLEDVPPPVFEKKVIIKPKVLCLALHMANCSSVEISKSLEKEAFFQNIAISAGTRVNTLEIKLKSPSNIPEIVDHLLRFFSAIKIKAIYRDDK